MPTPDSRVDREQQYVDSLYGRLDSLRDDLKQRLEDMQAAGASGTHQNRSERDAFASMYERRLAELSQVEERLCFGRIDMIDGDQAPRHIGRIGLSDLSHRSILTDWRAPAAEPFYQATSAHPLGISRRRHLTTSRRTVVGVQDEYLEPGSGKSEASSALLGAVSAARTGKMGDIVATIQAEQDAIIRASDAGPLVVQGGPGTGKTAVALHRAAYLLYAHRKRLERSGVLVVGPGPVFLRYIDQVLPSLGETGVVLSTIGRLLPDMNVDREDSAQAARVKGRLGMARVIKRAVRLRQRVPAGDASYRIGSVDLELRVEDVLQAQSRARRSHRPYNQARATFVRQLLNLLAGRYARAIGQEDPNEDDLAEIMSDLRQDPHLRRTINLCWMPMTPQRLLTELYTRPDLLTLAAPRLSQADREALHRDADAPWTVSDVPLLDEAAELLGEDETLHDTRRRETERLGRAEADYAQRAAEASGGGIISGQMLTDRSAQTRPTLPLTERASTDRGWTYGHVVVDEAQELSAMDWRMILRRCPLRSMTIVGDTGQTHSPAGTRSWPRTLNAVFGQDRWHLKKLTVNYRTPEQPIDRAEAVALRAGLSFTPVRSLRSIPDSVQEMTGVTLDAVAKRTRHLLEEHPEEKIALVCLPERRDRVRASLLQAALGPRLAAAGDATALSSAIAVLTPAQTKGLEFDSVIVIDPDLIEAETSGAQDLYVAMTRCAQRLVLASVFWTGDE